MSSNTGCTVYVGNLEERVSDRVLYDILIQAGRVVDLHIPRDRETDRLKGYAFAEYETEEIANYAVKLFSGLVTLYNRTLKFAISGRDKASQNNSFVTNTINNSSGNLEFSDRSVEVSAQYRASAYSMNNLDHSNGYGSSFHGRGFGSSVDTNSRSRSRRYDNSSSLPYPSY